MISLDPEIEIKCIYLHADVSLCEEENTRKRGQMSEDKWRNRMVQKDAKRHMQIKKTIAWTPKSSWSYVINHIQAVVFFEVNGHELSFCHCSM